MTALLGWVLFITHALPNAFTPIEQSFMDYTLKLKPVLQRFEAAWNGNNVLLGQYTDQDRSTIAFQAVQLAQLTKKTYDQIQSLMPTSEEDAAKKAAILVELKKQNSKWTHLKMPNNLPLFLSCIPAPVTGAWEITKTFDSRTDNVDTSWVQALKNGTVYLLSIPLVTLPITGVCLAFSPFYDIAKYSGYEPLQNVEIDLQEATNGFVIRDNY